MQYELFSHKMIKIYNNRLLVLINLGESNSNLTTIASYSDGELLTLLAQDNRDAFELLYRRYWLQLFDAAYQRLKNTQQAEDIVQDIFITIWTRRAVLKIANLPGYLHAAVRFRVLNYVARDAAAPAFYEPFEAIISGSQAADGNLLEKELIGLLHAYIKTLPKKRRQIFLLHLRENLSTKEIAGRLNISQKTVQNQLGTALHGLRTHVLPTLFFLFTISMI